MKLAEIKRGHIGRSNMTKGFLVFVGEDDDGQPVGIPITESSHSHARSAFQFFDDYEDLGPLVGIVTEKTVITQIEVKEIIPINFRDL